MSPTFKYVRIYYFCLFWRFQQIYSEQTCEKEIELNLQIRRRKSPSLPSGSRSAIPYKDGLLLATYSSVRVRDLLYWLLYNNRLEVLHTSIASYIEGSFQRLYVGIFFKQLSGNHFTLLFLRSSVSNGILRFLFLYFYCFFWLFLEGYFSKPIRPIYTTFLGLIEHIMVATLLNF